MIARARAAAMNRLVGASGRWDQYACMSCRVSAADTGDNRRDSSPPESQFFLRSHPAPPVTSKRANLGDTHAEAAAGPKPMTNRWFYASCPWRALRERTLLSCIEPGLLHSFVVFVYYVNSPAVKANFPLQDEYTLTLCDRFTVNLARISPTNHNVIQLKRSLRLSKFVITLE